MKSVVIEQPGELRIQTRPLPEPASGEVRVKCATPASVAPTCISGTAIIRSHATRA